MIKCVTKVVSFILVICVLLTQFVVLAAGAETDSFEIRVQNLAKEYGVTITMEPVASAEVLKL